MALGVEGSEIWSVANVEKFQGCRGIELRGAIEMDPTGRWSRKESRQTDKNENRTSTSSNSRKPRSL
jgi:hypothetical protein